jgi:hypothetical protein
MKTIHMLSIDSRHFSFDAFGDTLADAQVALQRGILAHARQYGIGPDFLSVEDAEHREITLGACYRDRAVLPIEPCKKPGSAIPK